MEKEIQDRLWSVSTRSDVNLDVAAPLKDRWIRYWPWPFGAQKKVDIADAIAQSPEGVRMGAEAIDEAKRLLYVSMTRARDFLVFGLPAKRGSCEWLGTLNAPWLAPDAATDWVVLPDGSKIPCRFRSLQAPSAMAAPTESDIALRWFPAPDSRTERLPAILVASDSVAQPCKIMETLSLESELS